MNGGGQFGLNFDSPAALPIVEEIREGKVVEQPVDESQQIVSRAEVEKNGQIPLIDVGEWWQEYWKGMPEFVQKDLAPWKTIYVHFENREGMEAFSKLVDQYVGLAATRFLDSLRDRISTR